MRTSGPVAGEGSAAIAGREHEREGDQEEMEFQITWMDQRLTEGWLSQP